MSLLVRTKNVPQKHKWLLSQNQDSVDWKISAYLGPINLSAPIRITQNLALRSITVSRHQVYY